MSNNDVSANNGVGRVTAILYCVAVTDIKGEVTG